MRLGWFGGTFDPPHNGHVAVAMAAVREFALDRLLVAPTGRQPLKVSQPVAPFADRLAMAKLLCSGESALETTSLDAPRKDGTANYTVDVLRELRSHLKGSDTIFVVVGADAFLDLRRWREPDALLAAAEWIVVSRPGFSLNELDRLQLTQEQQARVHLLRDLDVPISATELRRKLRDGEDCAGLVPATVLHYIHEHGLYQARREETRTGDAPLR